MPQPPYYQDDAVTLYCGDTMRILPLLGTFDHAITDPPYSSHVHANHRVGSSVGISKSKDLGFESLRYAMIDIVSSCFAQQCRRWAIVFSDVESCHLWREELHEKGLEHIRTGAWIKRGSPPQFSGDRPAAGFEAITIHHRGGRKRWNGRGSKAVWSYPIVRGKKRLHRAQKPVELMMELVEKFTDEGDLIVDPFAGSGTLGEAAKCLGRRAILIEQEEDMCALAKERIQNVTPLQAARC